MRLVVDGAEMYANTGGRTLAAVLPNARLAVIEGAGHMLLAERPDDVLAALAGS